MFSHSDTVIIDIQFLVGNNGTYFVKELAVLPANGVAPHYYLFKHPFAFTKLGKRAQYQNLYNQRYINNLDWYCGSLDYGKIKSMLLPFQNRTIIVKGSQKKETLESYLPTSNIIDLSDDFSL